MTHTDASQELEAIEKQLRSGYWTEYPRDTMYKLVEIARFYQNEIRLMTNSGGTAHGHPKPVNL